MIPKYSDEFVEDVLNNEIKNYNREDSIQEIVEKKTGVIFEIAFVSSYIIGGGDIKKIDDVKLASHYFGTIPDYLGTVSNSFRIISDDSGYNA